MFEDFKKIRIKGGCFEADTELEIFKTDSISIIYGRNGSGKTTIGLSIGELIKEEDERSHDFTVSSTTALGSIHKNSVFIFNEDFVREQVRVENDGINTIVMLGEQVELDAQIAQYTEQLQKKTDELKKLFSEKDRYESSKDPISHLYFFTRIKEALQSENGWADVDRELKGNKVKSKVTEDVVSRLMSMPEPIDNEEALRKQLIEDLKLFRESKNAQEIIWVKPTLRLPDNLDTLEDFLSKPIDAPILSEREKRLLLLLSNHTQQYRLETKRMLEEGWEFCPMCLREITEHDQKEIVQTLMHILNEEASKYEKSLNDYMETFAELEIELPAFNGKLHELELNAAYDAQTIINRLAAAIRNVIEQRRINIYESLEHPFTDENKSKYKDSYENLVLKLKTIEECVLLFNESINKRVKLSKHISLCNGQLSRKLYSALFLGYKKALENRNNNLKLVAQKEKEIELINDKIKALKSKKERTDIALDYINQELQYVFYSSQKVSLFPGDGCYKLKVNGRSVRPKKISVGERNVLGLCYFFAKLFGGKTEATKYTSEYLIVIDDPVSSFDYGNRIGVMSLLRYQFGNIINGNPNSRILVLSHDLQSIFDLIKIKNEVLNRSGSNFMELKQNQLVENKGRNEYRKLLEYVYTYAVSTSPDDPDDTYALSVGNVMRRMLEAYSSFCYNGPFEKMLRKDYLLNEIPVEKREYYGNFMYRLLLNTESHMEERIYSLDHISSCFTREEKIKTAKSILLFLQYVNRPHLESYLSESQMNQIDSWKEEENDWIK